MFEIVIALASVLLAYLLYRSNPEATEKWTSRGVTGWYIVIGITYLLIVAGLLMTNHPTMVLAAGLILFIMTLLVLVRQPFNSVRV